MIFAQTLISLLLQVKSSMATGEVFSYCYEVRIVEILFAIIFKLYRRSDTGFGIWDLARKLATKAKFGTFGQNRDFFGTILGPYQDFLSLFS